MSNSSTTFAIVSTIAVATLGYCVYFDFKRRNDPEFRRSLREHTKNAERKAKLEAKQAKEQVISILKTKLAESLIAEPLPTSPAEKEQFFMTQVGHAEKLAAIVGKEVDAAIHFYKALAIYPNPTAILDIYQKSVPAEVYELIMALSAILPPASISDLLADGAAPAGVDETD